MKVPEKHDVRSRQFQRKSAHDPPKRSEA